MPNPLLVAIQERLEESHLALKEQALQLRKELADLRIHHQREDKEKSAYQNTHTGKKTLLTQLTEKDKTLSEAYKLSLGSDVIDQGELEKITNDVLLIAQTITILGEVPDGGFLRHDWYIPSGIDETSLESAMGWDRATREIWRANFTESRNAQKGGLTNRLRNGYYNAWKLPEESPRLGLIVLVTDRKPMLEADIRKLEEMRSVRQEARPELKRELEKTRANLANIEIEEGSAYSTLALQIEKVEILDRDIRQKEIDEGLCTANLSLSEYELRLQPLYELFTKYHTIKSKLLNIADEKATYPKLMQTKDALALVKDLNTSYTEQIRRALTEDDEKIKDKIFQPIMKEQTYLDIVEAIGKHNGIFPELSVLLPQLEENVGKLTQKNEEEETARREERERRVNRYLDATDRNGVVDNEGADPELSKLGSLTKYLMGRSNKYYWSDRIANFVAFFASCFSNYQTEKEKREFYVAEKLTTALKTYRDNGDKAALMVVVKKGRGLFKPRAGVEQSGYENSLQYQLGEGIDKMPDKNDEFMSNALSP